jgi:hypothetical protein
MQINESYLKDMSDDQVLFSSQFLKEVFLYDKTNILLSEENLEVVCRLFKAVTSSVLKKKILSHLSPTFQIKLRDQLDPKEQIAMILYANNLRLIKPLFMKLAKEQQQQILQNIYLTDKEKYKALKKAITPKLSLAGNVWVENTDTSDKLLENEKQALLNMFLDPKLSYEDTAISSKRFEKKYDMENLEIIIMSTAKEFIKQKMPMSDPQSFLVHLKFHYFMDSFIKLFPALSDILAELTDPTVFALKALPDGKWVVKVLNQFPIHMIKTTLNKLITYEKISDFNKRNTYCKILNEIKNNLEAKEASNIRFAFSQI